MTLVWVAIISFAAAASGPREARDALAAIATGSRPDVERAIDRIQYLGTPKSLVHQLVRMANGEIDGSPQNALYALSVLHPAEAGPTFVSHLSSDDVQLRLSSCQGLARISAPHGAARTVAARLSDAVPAVRNACARTLEAWNGAGQGKALVRALEAEHDPDARLAEISALGHAPGKASEKALEPHLASTDENERLATAHALAMLDAPGGKKVVLGYATSQYADARGTAVKLLADVRGKWAADALYTLAADPDPSVALHAGQALVTRNDPRGIPALVLRAEKAQGADRDGFEAALAEQHVTQAQRLDIIAKAGGAK